MSDKKAKADARVAEYRAKYPDLTNSEEEHIRHATETGGCIVFRCRLENHPAIGFIFGDGQSGSTTK